MHELKNYVCEELKEIEHKAEREGKLSSSEIQYADTLAHLWKDILTAEAMEESEYSRNSYEGNSNRSYNSYDRDGRSYARGRGRYAQRDSMGRYSSERGYSTASKDEMMDELHELMNEAPNEQTRKEFKRFIDKMEQM